MSAAVAGIGTLFSGGAAAAAGTGALAAGTAAAAGGIFSGGGLGLIGSVIGGIGSAMMQKAEMREMERQQIAEEQRREARYRGLGEATKFWEQEGDSGSINKGLDTPQGRVGEEYAETLDAPQAPQLQPMSARPPRHTYDRNTGRLVVS